MRVVYKPTITEQIRKATDTAKTLGREIDYIELTPNEVTRLCNESKHRMSLLEFKGLRLVSFDGVRIKIVALADGEEF